jgi:hypothetical protein
MNRATEPVTGEPKYAKIIQRWEAFWSLEDMRQPRAAGVRGAQ